MKIPLAKKELKFESTMSSGGGPVVVRVYTEPRGHGINSCSLKKILREPAIRLPFVQVKRSLKKNGIRKLTIALLLYQA